MSMSGICEEGGNNLIEEEYPLANTFLC